jgi:polyprenyl-phospho-N-acetylgalactosaminyl synthase
MNAARKKVYFVIPAYNEAKSISRVVKDLKRAGYNNIIVIDDGSRDNTYSAAAKHGITVLKHVINRGQGAALKTGIDYALSQGADFIVTFDSDGQHRVEDVPAMLKPALRGDVDVTLGSRFLKRSHLPLSRKILLKGAIVVQSAFYRIILTDVHNGFRVLSRRAALKIWLKADRMEHASEIVEEIAKHKIPYEEVPVTIRYTGYSQSKGEGSFLGALRILYKMVMKKLIE